MHKFGVQNAYLFINCSLAAVPVQNSLNYSLTGGTYSRISWMRNHEV